MAERIFGIDISLYQKNIDLVRAKNEGVQYVIIKSSENTFSDPELANNVKMAQRAGLPFGFYHYLRSTTVAGAKSEAAYCINAIEKYKPFDYPVFLDVEDKTVKATGKANVTELVKAFCGALEAAGYWAGFYTNLDWYKNALDGAGLAKRYSFWGAYWGKTCPFKDAQMWQFGGNTNYQRSNRIAGIVCDQDYSFKDFPALIKSKGLNGYSKAVPKPNPAPVSSSLKLGDRIRINANATVYGSSEKFYPWVYKTVYKIVGITNGGNRIAFATLTGAIVGATDKKNVTKVG